MKIVFAGNCQAYALYYLYERHVAPERGETVGWVDAWDEPRLEDWRRELGDADIVIAQLFSNPTRVPVEALAEDKRLIRFPDLRGNFLWPYGNVGRIDNPRPAFKAGGPYDTEVGDAFLNRLIEQKVAPDEALARYLDHDVARETHLERVFELTLDQQRKRDALTGFSTAETIESRFRTERLFNTQGHLSVDLFHLMAAEVYGRLGATDTQIAEVRRCVTSSPFERYHDAPLHPSVIAHYRLACVNEDTRYHHVQEGRFSFSERVLRYMRNAWAPELHEGFAVTDARDWPRALALLDAGLTRAPGSAYGLDRRSYVLEQLDRWPEALADAEQAAALEPDDPHFGARREYLRSAVGQG